MVQRGVRFIYRLTFAEKWVKFIRRKECGSVIWKFNVPAGAPHARQYVDNWRLVSDNAQLMIDKVSGELAHAYQPGLDIQSDVVIGTMDRLAVKVWAKIDEYTGPDQYEGTR